MAKINWPTLGRIACVVGAVMSIGAIVDMGLKLASRPDISCPTPGVKPPTDPKAIVFAPPGQTLTINGSVCVAVRTKAYFATTVPKLATPQPTADTATASAPDLQAQATGSGAQPEGAAPQEDPDATETLALFFGDNKTPIKFDVRRRAPGEWTWQSVRLPATDNATDGAAVDWRKILVGPTDNGARVVRIGIGAEKAIVPRAWAGEATLRIYRPWRVWAIGLGLVLVVGGAIMWGWPTGMLRDRPPSAAEPAPPFSLGRSQMAFWFVLTLAGFLYIWLVTGQSVNVFTEDALILLGVSGATGLAAMTIGEGEDGAPPPPTPSQGYWTDVLSADGGIAIHRLQMVAWTVVLGLLFAWSILSTYQFKSFGTTLLLLSGIAGATYVGFKTREPTSPAQPEEPEDPPVEGQQDAAGQDTQAGAA